MTFTLKDIKGAVVEKKQCDLHCLPGGFGWDEKAEGWNQAIDAQSSVKLRFNREKILEALETANKRRNKMQMDNLSLLYSKDREEIADAIIAAELQIVELDK